MPSAPGQILKSIQTFFQTIVRFVFGEIQWHPPIWLRPIGRFVRSHPILCSLATIGIVLCAFAVYFVEHLPQPQFSSFTVTPPDITPLEKDLKPNPATILFRDSAAPLGKIGATVSLQMTPRLAGEWKWKNDRTLVFSPAADWPANTRYQVTLPETELANTIRLKSNVAEFVTQPLEVIFKDPQFYQDPVNADKRQVIATIETNFPVELDALQKQASLQVLGGSNLLGGKQQLEIVADLHQRRFFLRTANVTLPDQEDFVVLAIKQGLVSASGTSGTTKDEVAKVRVPDRYSFFSIESVEPSTARRENGYVVQLLVISTSTNTKPADIASALQVWLLPNKKNVEEGKNAEDNDSQTTDDENKNGDAKDNDSKDSDSKDSDSNKAEAKNDDANDNDEESSDVVPWKSPGEITDEVLKTAQRLTVTLEPEKEKFSQQHLFRYVLPKGGQLFVKIPKNTPAVGGYLLGSDYGAIVDVDA